MMNRTHVPFGGDIKDYAYGPEHQFFLWDTAADALAESAGGSGIVGRPARVRNDLEPRDGSEFGGGAFGVRNRDREMMSRGRADLTFGNLGRAAGIAAGLPGPLGAFMTAAKLARNPDPFTGYSDYDRDLIDAVGSGRMTRGAADREQVARQGSAGDVAHQVAVRDANRRANAGRGGGGGGDSGRRAATDAHDRSMAGRGYRRGGRVSQNCYNDGGIAGAVRSDSPGRADNVETMASAGTYVIPADVVSALGEGNTPAGVQWLDQAVAKLLQGDSSALKFRDGGSVPVRVSGGEYAVPPQAVAALGKGSYKAGVRKIEHLIAEIRDRTAKKLRRLPKPRR